MTGVFSEANAVRYRPAKSVYWCKVGDIVIFLDVARDRYLSLPPGTSGLFEHLLEAEEPPAPGSPAAGLARALTEAGLLEAGDTPSCPAAPRPAQRVYTCLPDDPSAPRTSHPVHEAGYFLQALLQVRLMRTKDRHLQSALNRHAGWTHQAETVRAPTPDKVTGFAKTFHQLTPYFITTRDTCLFRSLVMARYLSLRGVRSRLTFAVRIAPFSAHCWLEREGLVLNEQEDTIRAYTPILSV